MDYTIEGTTESSTSSLGSVFITTVSYSNSRSSVDNLCCFGVKGLTESLGLFLREAVGWLFYESDVILV